MNETPHLQTNPAARLIGILQQLQAANRNSSLFTAWTEILVARSRGQLFANLAELSLLVNEVQGKIKTIPNLRHEIYLKWVPDITALVEATNLDQSVNSFTAKTEYAITNLEFCSERLQESFPEPAIARDVLDMMLREISQLIKSVKVSKINGHLKLILFDLLDAARRAIDTYQLKGVKGLRADLFAIFANVQTNIDEIEKARDEPEVKGFMAWLSKVDKTTSTCLKVKELLSSIAPAVPVIADIAQAAVNSLP